MKHIAVVLAVSSFAALAQQPINDDIEGPSYGLDRGAVGINLGGGVQDSLLPATASYTSGPNPNSYGNHMTFTGGFDIGLTRHLGIWADLTGSIFHFQSSGFTQGANYYPGPPLNQRELFVGGGGVFTPFHRWRVVPYAKGGFGGLITRSHNYGNALTSLYIDEEGKTSPAFRYGGGVDLYLSHHIGIKAEATRMSVVGRNAGLIANTYSNQVYMPGNATYVTIGIFLRSK